MATTSTEKNRTSLPEILTAKQAAELLQVSVDDRGGTVVIRAIGTRDKVYQEMSRRM